MLVRVMSDLHLEVNDTFRVLPMEDDSDTILILAGDIIPIHTLLQWGGGSAFLKDVSSRFKKVLWVMGNHEYYGTTLAGSFNLLATYITTHGLDNITPIERDVVIVDDVAFIGATMWTDVYRENPNSILNLKRRMNDYQYIYKIVHGVMADMQIPIHPTDTIAIHKIDKAYLIDMLASHGAYKCVVITHHAPSSLSIHSKFEGQENNCGYYSDLSDIILDYSPVRWIHGHMHNSFDYVIGETTVVCNPMGYPRGKTGRVENAEWNPLLRFDI